jgi:heme-degrading monooxygenase HmoA
VIARLWRGRADPESAPDYARHVAETVFPSLQHMSGYRGAQLLRRAVDDQVEFVAVTFWDSLDDIRQFAGADIDVAKVEPRAEELLSDYDPFARHFDIAHVAGERGR